MNLEAYLRISKANIRAIVRHVDYIAFMCVLDLGELTLHLNPNVEKHYMDITGQSSWLDFTGDRKAVELLNPLRIW